MLTLVEPRWPAPGGVRAFCTTRRGGVSAAPFDSLNLALHVGDSASAVNANRGLLRRELEPDTAVFWLTQVHGTRVVEAAPAACAVGIPVEADAAWSRNPSVACAVLTADCLPVLLCGGGGEVVAAAHAGWRGLAAGVLEATIAAMDIDPRHLLAWLGPAIGASSFEVGPEVRAAFLARPGAGRASIDRCFTPGAARPGHFFADLYALARARLALAGVRQVFGGNFCTYRQSELFFSYRRDGVTGRMASVIRPRLPGGQR
ncbi:MAG: peptidoglycan editing factor PgeF [Halioglobus sp.]|nr:peptidoglycan editing factor PgeF [Halioglobus sp.]